ncbi:MAG: hypothetical protein MI864_20350, partial [Pseudomonadales bacterium]|nr:hypothetical protein [Pseudomonadales bacterium]
MNVRPSLVGLVLTISVLPLSSVQGQNLKTSVENTQNTMDFCVGRINDLVADYEVKLTRPEGEKMRETRRYPLQLIKDQHNVAYHYPNLQITDLWQRNGNGQLSLLKGF